MNVKVIKARLLSRKHVDDDGCWLWTGGVTNMNRGLMFDGQKMRQVSRLSYELFVGPIKKGLYVLHKCHKPLCYNPDCLYLGDGKQNRLDMINAGRNYTGGPSTRALTPQQSLQVCTRYDGKVRTLIALAAEYGVSELTIRKVITRGKEGFNFFAPIEFKPKHSKQDPSTWFESEKPCRACGSHTRYVKGKRCVHCAAKHCHNNYVKRRQRGLKK